MYNRKWYTNMCTRFSMLCTYACFFVLFLRHRCRVVFVLFSSAVHMPQREGMMRFGSHITVKDDIWNSSKSYNAIYSDVKLSHSLTQSEQDSEREKMTTAKQRPIATRSSKNTTFNLILFRFAYSSHNSSITFNYFSAKSKNMTASLHCLRVLGFCFIFLHLSEFFVPLFWHYFAAFSRLLPVFFCMFLRQIYHSRQDFHGVLMVG